MNKYLLQTILLCILSVSAAWAQRTYPTSQPLPDDVVWTREVYRTLDLTKGANGALYYPVEPQDGRMNLFTTLFRLLAQGKISAYEYGLDGTEHFDEDRKVAFRDVLDRFQIYYEMKKVKGRRDSIMSIHNSDVPSADVLSYFVKEVWYFDQRTSRFGSAITALCPVLHRAEEFSDEPVKLPMFWVRYADVAPYTAQSAVVMSDLNNVPSGSWDDFFAARLYKGDIYKVTNLQNRTLAQYCPTDSAMAREQRRIEREIADFERSLYGNDLQETDSTAVQAQDRKKDRTAAKTRKTRQGDDTQGVSKRESTSVKASVRRERR